MLRKKQKHFISIKKKTLVGRETKIMVVSRFQTAYTLLMQVCILEETDYMIGDRFTFGIGNLSSAHAP